MTYDAVEALWRAADAGRSGSTTIGILSFIPNAAALAWAEYAIELADLSRLEALPSNKANSETNEWEELGRGSAFFADIAEGILSEEAWPHHIEAKAKKVKALFEHADIASLGKPICVTTAETGDPPGRIMCIDGCTRLAAFYCQRLRGCQVLRFPTLVIGEGDGVVEYVRRLEPRAG